MKTLFLIALSAITALAGEMTGYVSDEMCAKASSKAANAREWIKPAAFESCVHKCVKAGSPVVFVTEDNKILKLDEASMKKIEPHLGHKVVVTGSAENGVLKIDSIKSVEM